MLTLNIIQNTRGEAFALSSFSPTLVAWGRDADQRKMFSDAFPLAKVFSLTLSERDCIDVIATLGGPGFHPGNEVYSA